MTYIKFFDQLQEAFYAHNYTKVITKIKIPKSVAEEIKLPKNITGIVGFAPPISVEITDYNAIELVLK